ncbi:hypothetical protein GOBAR_DD33403 [Gossypium barbadense]|nr:hypothetical protein GOBAR_DD33403 [Gossypium barbadense]
MDVVRRHRYHIFHHARSVRQSKNMGCQGVVGSVHDDGNAQIKPGVATVRVDAKNFAATIRPEGTVQGRHVREGQQRLGVVAWGTHRDVGL